MHRSDWLNAGGTLAAEGVGLQRVPPQPSGRCRAQPRLLLIALTLKDCGRAGGLDSAPKFPTPTPLAP